MKNVPRKSKDTSNMCDIADAIDNLKREGNKAQEANATNPLDEAKKYALLHIENLADELCLFQDGCLKGPFMRNLEHKLHKLCNGVNQQQLAISIIQRICIEIVSQHGE